MVKNKTQNWLTSSGIGADHVTKDQSINQLKYTTRSPSGVMATVLK